MCSPSQTLGLLTYPDFESKKLSVSPLATAGSMTFRPIIVGIMEQNRWSTRKSILILPVLAFAGLLSSAFALPFWFPLTRGNQSKYLFPTLQSLILGLTACAVLWGFGYIRNRTKFIGITAVVVAAHLVEQFLDPRLPQQALPCWECSSTSLFTPEVAIRFFLVGSMLFIGVLNLIEPRPKLPWIVLSCLGSAGLGSLAIGLCDAWASRTHAQLALNGEPLGILWQLTMAPFLGVAVCAASLLSLVSRYSDRPHQAVGETPE
jgi:hypothetical protein